MKPMQTNTHLNQLPRISDQNLLQAGWQILVKHLGYSQARRFLLQMPKPSGDSVQEIRKFREKYKTVDQLHQEILKTKKSGEI
jgi:hypothetical protein